MKRNVLDTLYSVNETLIDALEALEGAEGAAGAYMRVLARETRAARATFTEMLAALEAGAECLAAWMEMADPDYVREPDEQVLAAMRAAIAKAKGE